MLRRKSRDLDKRSASLDFLLALPPPPSGLFELAARPLPLLGCLDFDVCSLLLPPPLPLPEGRAPDFLLLPFRSLPLSLPLPPPLPLPLGRLLLDVGDPDPPAILLWLYD
jgi:hypothetical protein